MVYDNNYLLKLVQSHGIPKTLEMIDIEKIEDDQIKIICRTIAFSTETLSRELETRVQEARSKK
jgi:arsenate reductase-like glutaredoxin family protein